NLQPPSASDLLAVGTVPATASEIANSVKSKITADASLPAGIPAPLVDAVLLTDFFAANPLIDFVDPDGLSGPETVRLDVRRIYGPAVDAIMSQLDSEARTSWLLSDILSSVRMFVQPSGVVTENLSYDSYGRLTDQGYQGRFAYTGREWSASLWIYYLRARWYQPSTGRFLSPDPVGFWAGDLNLRLYVGNTPTYYVDPIGLDGCSPLDWILHPINCLYTGMPAPSEDVYQAAMDAAAQSLINGPKPGINLGGNIGFVGPGGGFVVQGGIQIVYFWDGRIAIYRYFSPGMALGYTQGGPFGFGPVASLEMGSLLVYNLERPEDYSGAYNTAELAGSYGSGGGYVNVSWINKPGGSTLPDPGETYAVSFGGAWSPWPSRGGVTFYPGGGMMSDPWIIRIW
ncbi:MAG: RHS repeat-associated core domain-containing protein, partial [Chloroflexi bacterium]|nr:RHS repeat-associated core domain-containing protein [Chloroflexota bacterium]